MWIQYDLRSHHRDHSAWRQSELDLTCLSQAWGTYYNSYCIYLSRTGRQPVILSHEMAVREIQFSQGSVLKVELQHNSLTMQSLLARGETVIARLQHQLKSCKHSDMYKCQRHWDSAQRQLRNLCQESYDHMQPYKPRCTCQVDVTTQLQQVCNTTATGTK